MDFYEEYVLEDWPNSGQYDIIVAIESDPHEQLFLTLGMRQEVENGVTHTGLLDNDAINGIIAMLEKARGQLNK